MRRTLIALTAAVLAASAAACNNPQSEPEPANEGVAAAMPETPDRSDTAADERAAGMTTPAPADAADGDGAQTTPAT